MLLKHLIYEEKSTKVFCNARCLKQAWNVGQTWGLSWKCIYGTSWWVLFLPDLRQRIRWGELYRQRPRRTWYRWGTRTKPEKVRVPTSRNIDLTLSEMKKKILNCKPLWGEGKTWFKAIIPLRCKYKLLLLSDPIKKEGNWKLEFSEKYLIKMHFWNRAKTVVLLSIVYCCFDTNCWENVRLLFREIEKKLYLE